ncbi:hypothetical protein OG225_43130 (plasmid) [Nocardia sp. NBC_01377]|uniref:hypothetical protein n=1 Tax=Nocardia sp. NBC_01377 TaxID=2903595 RepID=UPI002F90C691
MPTHDLAPRIAANIMHTHAPELALLAELRARPRIVATGGGCHAIEFDAAPSRTLYLLLTTSDHHLATTRDAIEFWCLSIYDSTDDDTLKSCAEAATFAQAHRAVWRAYLTGEHIE